MILFDFVGQLWYYNTCKENVIREVIMKELLFTRKFNKETYKFFLNKGVGCFGIYSEYISVETPKNCFGYTDTVLFNHGKAYTVNRYLQNWILKSITQTLIKKGYVAYMQ